MYLREGRENQGRVNIGAEKQPLQDWAWLRQFTEGGAVPECPSLTLLSRTDVEAVGKAAAHTPPKVCGGPLTVITALPPPHLGAS